MESLIVLLLPALIQVESSGIDSAVGDNGRAVGCLQLWQIYVRDVNRIAGTDYVYDDRYDRKKSIEMTKIYLRHYGSEKRLGHKPTLQDLARIHNGGPNGYKNPKTLKYWRKIEQAFKEMK